MRRSIPFAVVTLLVATFAGATLVARPVAPQEKAVVGVDALAPDSIAPDYVGTTVCYFHVSDLKRSLRWYGEALGFTEVVTKDDAIGWIELKSPTEGLAIGLLQSAQLDPAGGATLVFGVKDVDATRRQLEAAQVRFVGPTEVHPGYVKLAAFHDPDGHLLTLSQSLTQGDAATGAKGTR